MYFCAIIDLYGGVMTMKQSAAFLYNDAHVAFNHFSRVVDGWSIESHSHEVFELIFVKRASASYCIDGKEYPIGRHNLVLTRPFEIHTLNLEEGSVYDRYDILFDESVMPRGVYEKIPSYLNVMSFEGNSTVIGLFDKMDYYFSRLGEEELSIVIRGLIREVLINVAMEASVNDTGIDAVTNTLVCRAIEYISINLLTLGGVEDICRELYITKSHLHHLFMKHLHTTPKKYITTKRLALAQREILAGGKPSEVYLRSGFTDYSTFYRAYCNYFGRKPSDKYTANQGAQLRL